MYFPRYIRKAYKAGSRARDEITPRMLSGLRVHVRYREWNKKTHLENSLRWTYPIAAKHVSHVLVNAEALAYLGGKSIYMRELEKCI